VHHVHVTVMHFAHAVHVAHASVVIMAPHHVMAVMRTAMHVIGARASRREAEGRHDHGGGAKNS